MFIPLAENSGLIGRLSRWGIERGRRDAASAGATSGHDMSMAVNVSARLLTDLDLPVFVADVLERHGVPATRLTVEVTESTIMADPKRALEVLGATARDSASAWPSTTTAPATRRCPTCAGSRPTS